MHLKRKILCVCECVCVCAQKDYRFYGNSVLSVQFSSKPKPVLKIVYIFKENIVETE